MRYIEPTRVKVLMMMFFATGILGIVIGLSGYTPPSFNDDDYLHGCDKYWIGCIFHIYLFDSDSKRILINERKKEKLIKTFVKIFLKNIFNLCLN